MIFLFLLPTNFTFRNLLGKSGLNKVLKLLSVLFVVTIISSCEEIPDSVFEQKMVNYTVVEVAAPSSFTFSVADSSYLTTVKISNTNSVGNVWCRVKSLDGALLVSSRVELLDNGNLQVNGDQKSNDGIYSGKFLMSSKYPSDKYQIEYFVVDNVRPSPENLTKIASHVFIFDNGQNNLPPIISDLVIPATVTRGENAKFTFHVKVFDPNGLSDIYEVYFKLFRPDGTQVTPPGLNYILMMDNGDLENFGDAIANDGIYSYKSYYTSTPPAQTGVWRYEFRAKDRGGNLSNILTHNMTVN